MTSFNYIQDIILEQYSEKCFILKGNTIQYKQDIKQLGGMWNPSLKAWIFPNSKREVIEKWLDKGEKTVEPVKQYFESPVIENYREKTVESNYSSNLNSRIDVLEKKMDMIIEMLNKIHCKETSKVVKEVEKSIEKVKKDVKQVSKQDVKPLVKNTKENETDYEKDYEKEYEEYYEEEYEEVKPRKRLLVK
jgi:hypothetical protein